MAFSLYIYIHIFRGIAVNILGCIGTVLFMDMAIRNNTIYVLGSVGTILYNGHGYIGTILYVYLAI